MKINKQINIQSTLKNINVDEDIGIAYVSGWASKAFDELGNPIVDRDGEHTLVSNFRIDKARVLLRDHNMEYPVGKMKLTQKPQGLWIDAELHEKLCSKTFYAVKQGILDAFSIGFLVDNAEYINVKGKDVLQFTSGEIYETSILSVPSNAEATVQTVKSIVKGNNVIGLECSIEQIKSMNPNMDCSCLKDLKEETQNKGEEVKKEIKESTLKTIQDIIIEKVSKGLTIADTQNEPWHIDDNLWQMFRYFIETIEDNIYEFKWSESFDKDEMIENINSAMETFKQTVEIETTRINEVKEKSIKKGEQKNMGKETETKEVQESVQEETIAKEPEKEVESNKTTETEDSKTESKEEVISKESVTEVQEEEPNQDNQEDLAKTSEETPSKTEPQEPSKEEVKPQTPIKVSILDLNLEKASPDEIKEAYDTLAEKMDEIENYVEAELSKD